MDDDTKVRLVRFALAGGCALAAVASFYPVLRLDRRRRMPLLILSSAIVLASPFVVPPQARFLRCVSSVLAVTLLLDVWDLHVGAGRGDRPTLPGLFPFLVNIFSLVHRKLGEAPRPTATAEVRRVILNTAFCLPMTVLFAGAFNVDWRPYGFAVEHTVKVVLFFLVLVPLTAAAAGVWRLAGGRGLDFMDNPFAARTPADFWRRYNRPVHQFLQEDVFLPVGGRRRPVLGAIVVFLVSAAVHEYVFSVPVGRVQGYQTAFFLVQGIAVAATMRLKPRGPAAAVAVAATFVFNVATGVLFFASVDEVLPFYDNDVPLWDS